MAAAPFPEHRQIVKWVQFGSLLLFLLLCLSRWLYSPPSGLLGVPIPPPGHPKEATSQHVLLPSPRPVKRLLTASTNGQVGTSLYTGELLLPSGPSENVHVLSGEEIFTVKGSTSHCGLRFVSVVQLTSFAGLAQSPYPPDIMARP